MRSPRKGGPKRGARQVRMMVRGGVKAGDGARPSAIASPGSYRQDTRAEGGSTGSAGIPKVDSAQVRSQPAVMSIPGSHFTQSPAPDGIIGMADMESAVSALIGDTETATVPARKMAMSRMTRWRARPVMRAG